MNEETQNGCPAFGVGSVELRQQAERCRNHGARLAVDEVAAGYPGKIIESAGSGRIYLGDPVFVTREEFQEAAKPYRATPAPVMLSVPIGDGTSELDLMRALDFVCREFAGGPCSRSGGQWNVVTGKIPRPAAARAVAWLSAVWSGGAE